MEAPSTALFTVNISIPRAMTSSTPATLARASTAFLSASVQVGDLNITVSDRMAHSRPPAMALGSSTP